MLWVADESHEGTALPAVVAMPTSDGGPFLEHVFDPQKAKVYARIVRVDCENESVHRFIGPAERKFLKTRPRMIDGPMRELQSFRWVTP